MIKDTSAQDISVTKKNNFAKPVALIIGVLLIGSVAIGSIFADTEGSISVEKASLQISKVTQQPLIRDVAASGKIVAANAPKVYSPERGFVDLKVKAGDSVKKDDVIAIVKSPELTNELKQQQSVLSTQATRST